MTKAARADSSKRHQCGVELHSWARGRSSVLHVLACFSPIIRGEPFISDLAGASSRLDSNDGEKGVKTDRFDPSDILIPLSPDLNGAA